MKKFRPVFLALILMACGSTESLPLPTATSTAITQTFPEETIELDPLSKNLTQSAALPTSTITSTISHFKFLTIEETPQPAGAFEMEVLGHHIVSPNGQWALVDYAGFYVVHSSGEVIWELPINAHEELGKGWGGVFVADRWSPDSRYLFFTYSLYIDLAIIRGNGSGYWQLDIVDGTIREIMPVNAESPVRALALSPDQKMLVYISLGEPLEVTFHEIETKVEHSFPVPGNHIEFGDITWIGNQDFVFYVVGRHPITEENYNKFALIMFDVHKETQSMIFERIDTPIYLDWFDENTLELRGGDESLFYDVISNEFVEK